MQSTTEQCSENDWGTCNPRRRDFIRGSLTGLSAGLLGAAPLAQARQHGSAGTLQAVTGAFDTNHQPKPLPFDAAKLNGLSARMIESHWQNNYGGSVKALNETKQRLAAALSDRDLPAFIYNGLKREHLTRTGSVILHELYFENLGGHGLAPAGVRNLIASAFGEFDRWEVEFRRIAAGLGGGSGWVVFGYNRHFGVLENYWMSDHMHSPASTVPLLVMDMYEHSYQMDFGAAAARYIDAFFENINWDSVAGRIESIP